MVSARLSFSFLPLSGIGRDVSAKRLLVVATAPVDEAVLRDSVREHVGPDAEVRVVAEAGGRFYTASKEVKVTIGGCGG